MIIPENKIIVALDTSSEEKVLDIINLLEKKSVWIKLGMEHFYTFGPRLLFQIKERNFKIFLDLKLHDIPHTVAKGTSQLCKLPIDMLSIHASGGSEMLLRASEEVKRSSYSPLLIAVTQLTSTTTSQMQKEQRIPGDILESVCHYAKLAKECGCDGVVSSAKEVQAIKRLCGENFLTITPGIRPKGAKNQDQSRVTTPKEALTLGADLLVIGRPITEAFDPRKALDDILKDIQDERIN